LYLYRVTKSDFKLLHVLDTGDNKLTIISRHDVGRCLRHPYFRISVVVYFITITSRRKKILSYIDIHNSRVIIRATLVTSESCEMDRRQEADQELTVFVPRNDVGSSLLLDWWCQPMLYLLRKCTIAFKSSFGKRKIIEIDAQT